jgi:hypothetical protein
MSTPITSDTPVLRLTEPDPRNLVTIRVEDLTTGLEGNLNPNQIKDVINAIQNLKTSVDEVRRKNRTNPDRTLRRLLRLMSDQLGFAERDGTHEHALEDNRRKDIAQGLACPRRAINAASSSTSSHETPRESASRDALAVQSGCADPMCCGIPDNLDGLRHRNSRLYFGNPTMRDCDSCLPMG